MPKYFKLDGRGDMISGVIFDVGGVLISDGIRDYVYNTAAQYFDVDVEKIKAVIAAHENELYLSKFDELKYWGSIAQELHATKPPKPFWTEKYLRVTPVNTGVFEIIKKLVKKGYVLGVLSNTIQAHVDANRARRLYDLFDVEVFSCDPSINLRKPDIRIYQMCVRKMGISPSQCVFVDDNEKYLNPAKSLGMQTIHYTDAKQLEIELGILGVSV